MERAHRKLKKRAFHTGVGVDASRQHPVAFHSHAPIPLNQIGTRAVGADTSFNKTTVTGGVFSIGTPIRGPHGPHGQHGPRGKVRRINRKRGL